MLKNDSFPYTAPFESPVRLWKECLDCGLALLRCVSLAIIFYPAKVKIMAHGKCTIIL